MTQPAYRYPYKSSDWGFLRFVDIEDAEAPDLVYLRRFIFFKTPLCAVYLHTIYVPDNDRDPHNHPMPFLSVVLKGGYTERRWVGQRSWSELRTRHRFSFAFTLRNAFHKIERLHEQPTVTLLFCGPRSEEGWGFMTARGYIDQETYREGMRK